MDIRQLARRNEGTIPHTIERLTNLTVLNFGGAKLLSGTIPPSIGELVKLNYLNLDQCTKVIGTLPPSIGRLVNLQEMYLQYTGLSGTIPSTIVALTKLKNVPFFSTGAVVPITKATLSSTHDGHTASKCIDGRATVSTKNGEQPTFCHSSTAVSKAWIHLDLGSAISLALVKIYNRKDCCMDRFGEHVIETSVDDSTWTTCGTYTLPATYGPHEETCETTSARYVRLRMTHDGVLNLGEVEVYSPAVDSENGNKGKA